MGTINYYTSDYITIGLEPYYAYDLKNDQCFMEELQEEIDEYGGTIEEAIENYIQQCYSEDEYNIQNILDKYDFHYFHVVIKPGYYEGFSINIENNYGLCYDSWQDKREALKEATQIKKFLLECIDNGLCQVFPGWCTSYKDRETSIAAVQRAIKAMKEEIKSIPTWGYCERMGIEL